MGFALWIDGDQAWAQGTHEYRPMGSAVIGVSTRFTPRDFQNRLRAPSRFDSRFSGFFPSLGEMNRFLEKRHRQKRQSQAKKINLRPQLTPTPPPF